MTPTKGILESKTVWGLLVGITCRWLAAKCGFNITDDAQAELVILLVTLAGTLGDLWAFYGRVLAKHRLGPSGRELSLVIFAGGLLALSGCAAVDGLNADFTAKNCYAAVYSANKTAQKTFETTAVLYESEIIDGDTALRLARAGVRAGNLIDRAEALCPLDRRTASGLLDEAGALLREINGEQEAF